MNKEKTVLLNKKDIQYLKKKAAELRKYIILMNCYAGSGHPGGSLSAVEIITYLFHRELNFSMKNYQDQSRDRFILSKGHSCLALYAALAQKEFFNKKEFKKLRHINGMLQGHPDRLKTPATSASRITKSSLIRANSTIQFPKASRILIIILNPPFHIPLRQLSFLHLGELNCHAI